jgi:hypothetical protein
LRQLGFGYVGETAIGAYHTAHETAAIAAAHPDRSYVCTACPAVVRYVEQYRPELIDHLVPVVSPMLAHARHIRARTPGEVRIVFIGPCVAKKAEAERPEHAGLVDCVLTFVELDEWFRSASIDLAACEESDFDEAPEGEARLFPLEGGSVRTSGWSTDLLAGEVVAASGFAEICTALDGLADPGAPRLVEPLFCPQGCINGPAMIGARNLYLCRSDVLGYAAAGEGQPPEDRRYPELRTQFLPREAGGAPPVTEEQIRRVLEMTGKSREEDQLNCGACGYATCGDRRHGRAGDVHPAHETAGRTAGGSDYRDQPQRDRDPRRASKDPAHEPCLPPLLHVFRRGLRAAGFLPLGSRAVRAAGLGPGTVDRDDGRAQAI